MELETLFTSSKWEIIKRISQQKESPLQIAKNINTTIANVSQQLRLLEMAGLIKKEKLPNRAAGKPRMLFSLKDDFAYLITCTKEGVQKKLISLGLYQKFVLNTLLTGNVELQKVASELYFELEKSIDEIKAVYFNVKNNKELYVLGEKPRELQKSCERITRKIDSSLLDVKFLNDREFLKSLSTRFQIKSREDVLAVYDPNNMIGKHLKEVE